MTVDDKGKLVSRLCILLPSANRATCLFALPSEAMLILMPPVDVYAGEQRRSWGYDRWEKVANHVSSS
jgi:hypothetical protein